MKNTQKGFSTLLSLLLFIVLAGGGLYLYTEKVLKERTKIDSVIEANIKNESFKIENDTSNNSVIKSDTKNEKSENVSIWKTYTNLDNGIEFKYPSEAIVTSTSSGSSFIIYIDGIDSKLSSTYKYDIKFFISISPSFVSNNYISPEIMYSNPTIDGIVLGTRDWIRDLDKLGGGWSLEKSYWGDKGGYTYSILFALYGIDNSVDINTIENDKSIAETKIILENIVKTINIKQREIGPIIGITAPYKDKIVRYKIGTDIDIFWYRNKEVEGGLYIDLIDLNNNVVSQSITRLGVAGPDMIYEGSPYKLNTKKYPAGKYKIRISNYGKIMNDVSADSGWFILE